MSYLYCVHSILYLIYIVVCVYRLFGGRERLCTHARTCAISEVVTETRNFGCLPGARTA